MVPLHLDILLKFKIANLFGKIPVVQKNSKKINSIPYKNIIPDCKNHHNNLIGKIICHDFDFYYIPFIFIENYEQKKSGIAIYSNCDIEICPFCFGIQLDIEEQNKFYKMMKKKDMDASDASDTSNTITDDIYKLLKKYFCFELVKKK